jgi:hypothetical protein
MAEVVRVSPVGVSPGKVDARHLERFLQWLQLVRHLPFTTAGAPEAILIALVT